MFTFLGGCSLEELIGVYEPFIVYYFVKEPFTAFEKSSSNLGVFYYSLFAAENP